MISNMSRLTAPAEVIASASTARWKLLVNYLARLVAAASTEDGRADADAPPVPIFCCGIGRPVYVHPPAAQQRSQPAE